MEGADGMSKVDAEGVDASDEPVELVETTVNVYDDPLVNPVTVIGLTVLVAD